jgi:hypothetical protein
MRTQILTFTLVGLVTLFSPLPAMCQTATITDVNVYKQTTGNPPALIVEIIGTNLLSPETPRLLVFPSTGATVTVLDASAAAIRAAVAATQNYTISEVALSYSNGTKSKAATKTTCSAENLKRDFFYVPEVQARKKYGRGVGIYFDVIQVSVVNKCSLPVLIPLAGIFLSGPPNIYPFSLDHVTSIYSNDRQFSGPRAIYFNVVQGLATIGSAIEPFFAHGFTQGVSILGGGFTQASATIWKDLSAEQLQNLASQSFQSTEQVGPNGGSLQKFIFLPKAKKKDKTVERKFAAATAAVPVGIHMEIIPVITEVPTP